MLPLIWSKTQSALLLGLCLIASAGARSADLPEIFRLAQVADPAYAQARAAWAATHYQERLPQARAGLLPLVGASASIQRIERETRFIDSPLPRHALGL